MGQYYKSINKTRQQESSIPLPLNFGLSLVGLVALWLAPWWAHRITTIFTSQPGPTLLVGLVGLVLIPLMMLLLCATVIGIPLAFIVLALYVVALLLSGVLAAWFVGGWLFDQFQQPNAARWLRMIVGAFVVSVLVSLPLLGALFGLLIVLAGLGALLLERRAMWQQVRAEMASVVS